MDAVQHRLGAAFFVEVQDDRTSVTVTVLGEVDLASRAALDSCLNEALTVDVNAVLVELSGLSFIDLTGMRTILEFERECRRRGVEPRLVSSSGVDKALDILENPGGWRFGFPSTSLTLRHRWWWRVRSCGRRRKAGRLVHPRNGHSWPLPMRRTATSTGGDPPPVGSQPSYGPCAPDSLPCQNNHPTPRWH